LAMGSAGQQFLKAAQGALKEMAIINAVLPNAICDVTIPNCSGHFVPVGSRVLVKQQRPTQEIWDPLSIIPANQVREAIVVSHDATQPAPYTVLYDDDVEETDVGVLRFEGLRSLSLEPSFKLEGDMLMAMCLVEVVTTEPCRLMKLDSLDIWKSDEPEKVLSRANLKPAALQKTVQAKLHKAGEIVGFEPSLSPPPEGFFQKFMASVGSSASLDCWGSQLRALGQKIMYATFLQLARGCTVYSRHLSQVSGDYCGILAEEWLKALDRKTGTASPKGDMLESWKEELALPTLQALNFLVAEQVLHVSEVVIDCEPQKAFVMVDSVGTSQGICPMLALAAVCRFSAPTWDALDRCCMCHHRPWHRPQSGCRKAAMEQELLAKKGRAGIVGATTPLAQYGFQRPSLKASNGCQNMSRPRSGSCTQIDRYRRRNTPVLWGAETAVAHRSVFQKSGNVIILENVKAS